MQCETARMILELDLARMGEADWRDLDAVEAHMAACLECQAWRRQRFSQDNLLARHMRAVPAPPLPAIPKYPKPSKFTLAAKKAILLGAAMIFFLAVAFPWIIRGKPSPLNLEAAAWLLQDGFEPDVDGPTIQSKRAELERRFALLGVHTRLPEGMDYSQLLFSGLVELQGKPVPQLVFATGPGESLTQVLVFDSRQFDLSSLPETFPAGSGSSTPSLVATDNAGRFVALVADGYRRKPPIRKPAW